MELADIIAQHRNAKLEFLSYGDGGKALFSCDSGSGWKIVGVIYPPRSESFLRFEELGSSEDDAKEKWTALVVHHNGEEVYRHGPATKDAQH